MTILLNIMHLLFTLLSAIVDAVSSNLLSIICSIIASFIFWYFSFKRSYTKIVFAEKIEKSKSVTPNANYRYRLKLINVGRENLVEVSYRAKITIVGKTRIRNSCYIQFGQQNTTPVLFGRRYQMKHKDRGFSWTLPFILPDTAFIEYSKAFYPEEIRTAAKEHSLTLEMLLNYFKDNITITVYAFGNDSVTGARRVFISNNYRNADIVEGRYQLSKWFKNYNEYVSFILSIRARSKITCTKEGMQERSEQGEVRRES